LPQHRGPQQMGGQVEIAEPEPGAVRPEGPELLGGPERLSLTAPSTLAVADPSQPVGDRVQIGRDVEAVHLDVVSGIHDHRDVLWRHDTAEPAKELPSAHTSSQRRHAHGPIFARIARDVLTTMPT